MKNVALLLISVLVFLTSGCGGGGGNTNSDTPTPAGTAVNISAIKSIYTGTVTTGTQASFLLNGSDLQGNTWTGSYSVISGGVTTFETQNVTSSQSVLTIQKVNTPSSNFITSRYYLTSSGATYKVIEGSGRTLIPIAEVALPDVPRIGEGGTGTTSNSDGTTSTITWSLDPDINGNSKLSFSTVTKAADNSIVSEEKDSFFLNSNGNIYKMTVVVSIGGTTITLSGNKN